jgi:murein DD-endopeptidase MepM/ murein hydrolase activator NlpD
VVIGWYNKISTLVQTWWGNIKKVVIDWYWKISTLVQTWWTNIKKVVIDWFAKVSKLVLDWFNIIKVLAQDYWGNLSKLMTDFYTPLFSFFTDPAAMIFSIIEAYAWKWGEWFASYLLGGVNFEPPERPKIGEDGFVGEPPPPGPGPKGTGLIWPASTRRISGHRFNPPSHNGLDIGVPLGAPIWSIAGGVVTNAGWSNVGYGNYVTISHNNGAYSLYGHFSKLYVWAGKSVTQGETIGASGSTGNSTGPHLHIEVKVGGRFVDPLSVLE